MRERVERATGREVRAQTMQNFVDPCGDFGLWSEWMGATDSSEQRRERL